MDNLTKQLSNLNINDKDMDTFTSLFNNLSLQVPEDIVSSLITNMESLTITDNTMEIKRNDDIKIQISQQELKVSKDDKIIFVYKLFLKCGFEYQKPFESINCIDCS